MYDYDVKYYDWKMLFNRLILRNFGMKDLKDTSDQKEHKIQNYFCCGHEHRRDMQRNIYFKDSEANYAHYGEFTEGAGLQYLIWLDKGSKGWRWGLT